MGLGVCIQAGGRGERLRALLGELPKALAPFGGGTLLSYQLDRVAGLAPERIVVLTHDRAEAVRAALPPQVEVLEELSPLGTAGGLAGLPSGPDTWLSLNVDHVSDADLAALLRAHAGRATAAVHRTRSTIDEGVVTLEGGRLVDYRERPQLELDVTVGLYVFAREALAVLDGGPTSMPELIRRLMPVQAWPLEGTWIDAGTPERLAAAEAWLAEG